MSRIKTILAAGLIAATTAVPALPSPDLVRAFAGCAGRFSAEMEHAWLTGDARADHFSSRRLTFVSLLDATVPEADRRAALHYRVGVKLAHAALLTRASFTQDADRATRARTVADGYLVSCNRLLLDS